MESFFPRRVPKTLLMCALLTLCGGGVAFGISLPWLSEDSAVERVLNKIWYAILHRDEKSLRTEYLTGLTVDNFLKQEIDQINRMGIQEITCRIKKIELDPVNKQWAWVDFEKSAHLKSGQTLSARSLAVFKKENGFWKLVTGASTRRNPRKPAQPAPGKSKARQGDKPKGPDMNVARDKAEQIRTDSEPFKFDVSVSGSGQEK